MYTLYRAQQFDDFYPYLLAYDPVHADAGLREFDRVPRPRRPEQASTIRLWGTIGWIAAGLIISYAFAWDSRAALLMEC